MGFKDVKWAYEQAVGTTDCAVLVAVCVRTNDLNHETFVGQETIAGMTKLSRSSVNKSLATLESLGLITRIRRNGPNGYRTSDLITANVSVAYVGEANEGEANVGDSVALRPAGSGPMSSSASAYVRERDSRREQPEDQPESHPEGHPVSRRQSAKILLPDTWHPNDSHSHIVLERGLHLTTEEQRFRDHARSEARRSADWDAAFRNWLSKASPQRLGKDQKAIAVIEIGERLEREQRALARTATDNCIHNPDPWGNCVRCGAPHVGEIA